MKSQSRRAIRFWSLFLVTVLVIAACDGGETTDTTTGGTGGEASGEPVELLVWASRDWYAPPDNYDAFNERHEGEIHVTLDVQANDDILQQLQRMQDADQPMPDLVQDDTFLIEAYNGRAGHAIRRAIAALGRGGPRGVRQHPAHRLGGERARRADAGLVPDRQLRHPLLQRPLVRRGGIRPSTIDSLDGVLEGIAGSPGSPTGRIPLTVQALPTTGVTLLKTFFSAAGALRGAVPDLQSPGGIYTLEWFLTAAEEGLIPSDAISWDEDQARGVFLAQDAAMILDGFTVAGDLGEEPGFDYETVWNVIPVPASQTGAQKDGNQISNARTWFLTSGTEHPYEAGLAMRYVNETLVEAAANGSVPMRNSRHLADPRLDEIWPFFTDQLREAYAGSASVPAGLNGGDVEAVLEQMFGEIVVGTDKTAQELADEYQPQLDEL